MRRLLHTLQRRWGSVVCATLLLVVLVGAGIWFALAHRTQTAAPQRHVLTYSTSKPSEKQPDPKTYQWTGAPNDPKYITLPTINSGGYIQAAGVDQDNQIAVPDNIYMAAWFIRSVRPGQPGLSIIDGHVTGWVNNGIFKDLQKLKSGDRFTVESGDGTVNSFKVFNVQTVPVADAVNVLFSQDPAVARQLNLITCGGVFNHKTSSYESRVIVSAALAT